MKQINGTEIIATVFAFDGCHKIYLLNDSDAISEAEEYEYDIYDIDSIVSAFVNSCPLRFICEWGGDFKSVVKQACSKVVFEGFDIDDDLSSFEYDINKFDNKITLTSFSEWFKLKGGLDQFWATFYFLQLNQLQFL